MNAEAEAVLDYWFKTLKPEQWWVKDETLDAEIGAKFGDLLKQLAQGVPEDWLASPRGTLAAVIVLDQFSRNIHRGTAQAFGNDGAALDLAKAAVARGDDQAVATGERTFFYLPFEHSEDLTDQDRSVALFAALGDPNTIDFAERHRAIIARFGRFPHRNALYGRTSTPEEEAFLKEPGSSF